jgi:CheY-like chemotaxis protein
LFKENPDRYDFVLTDYSMPGMTGIDLTRELISIRKNVPVILITAYRDVLNTAAAHDAGVGVIVAKPMTRVDLSTAMKRVLARRAHKN